MGTKSKKSKYKPPTEEELDELYIGKEARERLRKAALAEEKRVLAGEWTTGMGTSSSQMIRLLDYIDELESKVFDKQLEDKLDKE